MTEQHKFAEVAPAIPLPATGPQTYTYKLSKKQTPLIRPFTRVTVPFGHQTVSGVVIKLHSRSANYPTKHLATASLSTLTSKQVTFARWIAKISHGGLGYTLRLFQPPGGKLAAPNAPLSGAPALSNSPQPPLALINRDPTHRCRQLKTIIKQHQKKNGQVLIITPEKWLAEHLCERLQDLSPALVHTDLKSSRLAAAWQQVQTNQSQLIIGTQKALFLPFVNLKLIIIEEEQYTTHKLWDQYPRLHNIPAAQQFASIHCASLLYTSSFPSLRLRHAMKNKTVKATINNPLTPHTSLITYSFEDKVKRYILPTSFVSKLRKWLKNKEEVLLFFNQRDNKYLKDILEQNHLSSSQLTLSTSAIFAAAPDKKFDRIVWLHPERSLNYPDFRSAERTLITLSRLQQSLSNPRRSISLIVRWPDTIEKVFTRPTDKTFSDILKERQRFFYPPFTDLVRLTIKAKTKSAAMKRGSLIRQQIDRRISKQKNKVKVRGPFHDLKKTSPKTPETHILLAGSLKTLTSIYKDLAIDSADLMPERIL